MDWLCIQGDWQHYKGLAHLRWMKLSVADLDIIAGRRELLAAQMQLESWQGQQRELGAA